MPLYALLLRCIILDLSGWVIFRFFWWLRWILETGHIFQFKVSGHILTWRQTWVFMREFLWSDWRKYFNIVIKNSWNAVIVWWVMDWIRSDMVFYIFISYIMHIFSVLVLMEEVQWWLGRSLKIRRTLLCSFTIAHRYFKQVFTFSDFI